MALLRAGDCAVTQSARTPVPSFTLPATFVRLSAEAGGTTGALKDLRSIVDWFPPGLDVFCPHGVPCTPSR